MSNPGRHRKILRARVRRRRIAVGAIAALAVFAMSCGGGAGRKVVLPPGIDDGQLCAQVDVADPTRDEGPILTEAEIGLVVDWLRQDWIGADGVQ